MKPLLDKQIYILEKYPGKGGWTYVHIPKKFKTKKKNYCGKKCISTIDGYEIIKIIIYSYAQ